MADPSATRDSLMREITDRYDYATNQWGSIRSAAREDMRYVAGDPWKPKDRAAREKAGRPCLALDELQQYFNQTINNLRLNPRGIKFAPTGEGANDKGAELYEKLAREIEYRSHAQVAYLTAAENMIHRSYGWVRVDKRWADGRSFDQQLWIQAIPNPDMVVPDPDFKAPDASDLTYLFFAEPWPLVEFQRKFPRAKTATTMNPIGRLLGKGNPVAKWLTNETILLAEYWAVEAEHRELIRLRLPDGRDLPLFRDELEEGGADLRALLQGAQEIDRRSVDWPRVIQRLTNGVEVLEETAWPGRYLPFAACFGKVLYLDGDVGSERVILSMTRLARDAFMAYCFYRTCEIENVGLTTKNPYWAYEGQLSPQQITEIQRSLHEPMAVLFAKATIDGVPASQPLPLPQRNPIAADLQGLSIGAEEMRRAIQAAMGISPLPTVAQRQNEKSGAALRQIESSGQMGSYHYVDAYDRLIRRVGVILEDLIDKVYGHASELGVIGADGKAETVQQAGPQLAGTYQVTVSTGPAKESERQAADDFVDSLVSGLPVIAQIATPPVAAHLLAQSIRLKDLGPIGDDLAKTIDPPQFTSGSGMPDPRVLQLQAQIKQLEQVAQQLSLERATEKAKLDGEYSVESMKADRKAQLEITLKRMDIAGKILAAQIAGVKEAQSDAMTATEERIALGAQLTHEALQSALDREHERAMAQYQTAVQAAQPAPTGASA